MHSTSFATLTRRSLPAGVCFALAVAACSSGSGENPAPRTPGSSGAGAVVGAAGKAGLAGAGGTGAGAGAGGTGATAGTIGAGGGAGQLATGGASGKSGSGGMAPGGSGGGGSGGMSAGSAGAGAGGAGTGSGGTAGGPVEGAGAGGSAGANGGAGAQGGAGGGGWTCPSGVTGTPTLSGTPTRITSVPPVDAFNMNNGNFGNIEGPVWIGDALYVSEMSYMSYSSSDSNVKESRILKVTPDGQTSIFIADSGSNGLAVDASGNIVAAVHKDGSITRFSVPGGTPTTLVSMFMSKRFDSPNDLVIHSNGTIYFSDPNFQAPNTLPQAATRAYRVPPGGQAEPIPNAGAPDTFSNPNGITLSLAEDYLYVAAATGRRYPVMADGTLGAGSDYAPVNGGDGVTVNCAGNLYVAVASQTYVAVYKPDGTKIGQINVTDVQSVTNVAFGGTDHKTLYITGLGNNKGLFKLPLDIAGRPY